MGVVKQTEMHVFVNGQRIGFQTDFLYDLPIVGQPRVQIDGVWLAGIETVELHGDDPIHVEITMSEQTATAVQSMFPYRGDCPHVNLVRIGTEARVGQVLMEHVGCTDCGHRFKRPCQPKEG